MLGIIELGVEAIPGLVEPLIGNSRLVELADPGVRIIAVSGGDRTGTVDLKEHARLMGAFKVLAKPFEMDDVLAAVKEALGA